MTTYLSVFPVIGTTYPDANGVPITSAGATVARSKYISDALERGYLLTSDPLAANDPDDRTQFDGVDASDNRLIDPADYGVSASNTATQNATGLRAMRDYMLGVDPDAAWTVLFRSGTYYYNHNKWINGLTNLVIDLNGSTLIYEHPPVGVVGDTVVTFSQPDLFTAQNDEYNRNDGDWGYFKSYPIASTTVGATSVTLTTPADAVDLEAGDAILIAGHDSLQGGYPPNLDAFEYNEVVGSNAGTGVVTLRTAVKFRYLSTWPDHAGAFALQAWGKARIFKLSNRQIPAPYEGATAPYYNMCAYLTIRNGTIDATETYHRFMAWAYKRVLVENVTFKVIPYIVGSQQNVYRNVILEGANAYEVEVDKMIEQCCFENSNIRYLGGASGCRQMALRNVRADDGVYSQAEFNTYEAVSVGPSTRLATPIISHGSSVFKNVSAFCAATAASVFRPVDWVDSPTYTIAGGGVSGNNVTLTVANAPLSIGDYLIKTDGSKYGRITGSTNSTTFTCRWSTTPVAGESFYYMPMYQFSYDTSVRGGYDWPGCIADPYTGTVTMKGPNGLSDVTIDQFMVPLPVTSITVDVTTSGTAGRLYVGTFGVGGNIASIDLTAAGARIITPAGTTGAQAGDTITHTMLATYRPRLRFDIGAFSATFAEWPRFTVTVACVPLGF